jgi:hypothetical protein
MGDNKADDKKVVKKHAIRSGWIRIPLKVLMWILVFMLVLPVLVYLPPVQDLAVKIAVNVVRSGTGMTVGVGKLRLKFPLDVSLRDVYVLTEKGDTMARAGEALADVKLLPLLRLDIDINRLLLRQGYYAMASEDSSMLVGIHAGLLEVDDRSSFSLAKNEIILNKAKLRDGRLSLYMNVWKEKSASVDTAASTPFLIKAKDLKIENFNFGMSMLPVIDTLGVDMRNVEIADATVDLRENLVKWRRADVSDGTFRYLTPDEEWIKSHPEPPSKPSSGPPMRIMGDSISLQRVSGLYAIKGASPAAGFDPSYISVSGVAIGMRNFYNEGSVVRLPLTRLSALERSGLQIVEGRGLIGVDSVGLTLGDISVKTLFSTVRADAGLPFATMALGPGAPMSVKADGRLGLPDIESFMPSLKEFTLRIPARRPLDFDIDANGTVENLVIDRLRAEMPEVLRLEADGYARNLLDLKKLQADVTFDGGLYSPRVADSFLSGTGVELPAFTIKGSAGVLRDAYHADFRLLSDAGDIAADGRVSLGPETYSADIGLREFDVARFYPAPGIGRVSATIRATGAGFNPLSGHAVTDALVNISRIRYRDRDLSDITADVILDNGGNLSLCLNSPNQGLDFDIEGTGTIRPDNYAFDIAARLRDVDLWSLGLTDNVCAGKGDIYLKGAASPGRWVYDVSLKANGVDWNLPGNYIHLPGGFTADVKTDSFSTEVNLNSLLTTVNFRSSSGLPRLISGFGAASDSVLRQIERKNLAVNELRETLPPFTLDVNASGRGLLAQFLHPQGLSLDTIYGTIACDSMIRGDITAMDFRSSAVNLDTMTLTLKERGKLLDYRAHIGNRKGTFDEFAQVNLNGYLGHNRLGAFLNQRDLQGKTGYRLGLTAALMDSVLTVHLTPLKATIAYLPWTINDDNYVDYHLYSHKIYANLLARSAESSVMARTESGEFGDQQLRLKIDNLKIQDFLSMSVFAPPLTASVSTDLAVGYRDNRLLGKGTVGVKGFTYNNIGIGDLDLWLDAGYGFGGSTDVKASMNVNGEKAMSLYANMSPDENQGMKVDSVGLTLTRFPLKVANPFLGGTTLLSGFLNGDMTMGGKFSAPVLNGELAFDSVAVKIPQFGVSLNLPESPVTVADNVLTFSDFEITAANSSPLSINGTVNARKFSDIRMDLGAQARNFQLLNSDKRSRADLYGKVFLDVDAKVKGPLSRLFISGDVDLLGTTDATYRLNMDPNALAAEEQSGVVRFVNFNDSTQVADADSIAESPLNMIINAGLVISPGTQVQVILSSNGTDKVELQPTADLHYRQNYMGDMTLNGTLTLGNGFVRYSVPVIGEKMFIFDPASTLRWNGPVANPILNITAFDEMKANVTSGSNSRLVNFIVTLHATDELNKLKASFDLSTNDDLTIQNELQSMSPDQRQTQAMNMLLYGQYIGANTKANVNSGNALYGFLESRLNSMAAKYVRGVDLSFGINQYDRSVNGSRSTQTSYSYQVSKSLFNNRFKIRVGGNYSTDASPDENLAQNIVSDVSLEYIIRQTQTSNMSVRLFRHAGYESILEGEVIETGVGFVYKRRLDTLLNFFGFGRRKSSQEPLRQDSTGLVPADSVTRQRIDTNEDE